MDKSTAALGSTAVDAIATCLVVDPANLSPEERIFLLEEQMRHMQRMIIRMKKQHIVSNDPDAPLPVPNPNKDGIPVGTVCFGATEKSPFLYYLTVESDGYIVGSHKFESLSAAAETVSLVRRSGWTFWKLLDGRTLKDAYRT